MLVPRGQASCHSPPLGAQPTRQSSFVQALIKARDARGARALERCLREAVLAHAYPRLDLEVSKKMNHLLKAPFCVHPKTGRVCLPIDPTRAHEFDPETVVTVGELLQQLNAAGRERDATVRHPSGGGGVVEEGPVHHVTVREGARPRDTRQDPGPVQTPRNQDSHRREKPLHHPRHGRTRSGAPRTWRLPCTPSGPASWTGCSRRRERRWPREPERAPPRPRWPGDGGPLSLLPRVPGQHPSPPPLRSHMQAITAAPALGI